MHSIPEPLVIDARAKIVWGEAPANVLAFLQSKSIGDKDAFALIEQLMRERDTEIRSDGRANVWMGILCILVPIIYYILSLLIGYWSMKLFAALIVLGVFGLIRLTKGISMVLRPRGVTGSRANSEL